MVQTTKPKVRWTSTVCLQAVSELYARHAALDVPGYYEEGEVNPWKGLTRIVPQSAQAYAVVLEHDEVAIAFARTALKAFSGRKKPRETTTDKNTANFDQFSKPGRVVVLYA